MILIESQGPVPPMYIKYMNEEGIKVSARPILVFTCLELISFKLFIYCDELELIHLVSAPYSTT